MNKVRLNMCERDGIPLTGGRSVFFALCLTLLCLAGLLRAGRVWGSSDDAIWPEFVGDDLLMDGSLMVDETNAASGYVLAGTMNPTENSLKLRMEYDGMALVYDIDSTGEYTVIPLQLGSGAYTFSLFENAGGTKYSSEGKVTVNAELEREDGAFLVTNQYVDYTKESPSVQKSDEMYGTAGNEADMFASVCSFMTSEFAYDYIRALSISPGELPEVDTCYENRLGICQDLSAVMISMLRVQGIPSRLMIGYADGNYHAWTVSEVNGEEKFFDPTAVICAIDVQSYQAERYY